MFSSNDLVKILQEHVDVIHAQDNVPACFAGCRLEERSFEFSPNGDSLRDYMRDNFSDLPVGVMSFRNLEIKPIYGLPVVSVILGSPCW